MYPGILLGESYNNIHALTDFIRDVAKYQQVLAGDRTGHRHLVRGKVLVESIHPDCGEVSERNPLIIFFRFLHFLYPLVHRIYENSIS